MWLVSGDRIHFPFAGEKLYVGKMTGESRVLLGVRLDPNADDAFDLEAVPGIGPKTADKIIRYRETKGPIKYAAELQKLVGARVDVPRYFEVEGSPGGGEENQEGKSE